MANDDDDIPAPDAEATSAERAHAKTFAELVDKTLAGRTPPAMSAEDRALVEVATVIRAASGASALSASAQRSIIEDALKQAIGGGGASLAGASGTVTPIQRARARKLPWVIAATSTLAAVAALAALWLRSPRAIERAAADVPLAWRSRPADALIGPIDPERSGDASTRIDAIFADRLDGYREQRAARGGSR